MHWEQSLVCLGIVIIAILVFTLTHLRPLTNQEVSKLAIKRRFRNVRKYFSFIKTELVPNAEFKKKLEPKGRFYYINEELSVFPSIAAALLKYKKHEWILIAFETEKEIKKLWVNKGQNNSQALIFLSADEVADYACKERFQSVMIFHNHPNRDPNHLDCTKPSQVDLKSAEHYGNILAERDINLLEFICERGKFYQYYSSISKTFLPLADYWIAIRFLNGKSRVENLRLHLERLF